MTLTEYVRTIRFPAELDAIEESIGEVPEGLMECLRKGVVVEAMEAKAADLRTAGKRPHRSGAELFLFSGSGLIRSWHQDAGVGDYPRGIDQAFALFTEGTDFISKHAETEAIA